MRSGRSLKQKSSHNLESCYTRLIQNGIQNTHALFELEVTDILINAGTALIYITGLIGFVAWLERSKAKHKASIAEA